MAPQAYKIINNHAHKISGQKILSGLFNSRATHLGGMNGDNKSNLSTLALNYREQLLYFHSRILRLQQGIILSEENVPPTRLLFHYMKALSKSDKIKASIAPNMTDPITLLDNNIKSAVYTGGNIHGIYNYIEIIVTPNTLTTSGQRSNNLGH